MHQFALFQCELRGISQRKPDESRASSCVHGKNQLGSKSAALGFTDSTPAHLHPLFSRVLISRERYELPLAATLSLCIDRHEVTTAYPLPARTAHDDGP